MVRGVRDIVIVSVDKSIHEKWHVGTRRFFPLLQFNDDEVLIFMLVLSADQKINALGGAWDVVFNQDPTRIRDLRQADDSTHSVQGVVP